MTKTIFTRTTLNLGKMGSVLCPHCKAPSSLEDTHPYRPFCSERCKLIDFGNWANEEYAVPTDEKPPTSAVPN